MTPWHLFTILAMACGAVVPGPCSFQPDPQWDCSLGDPCAEGFACASDGFCKSADIACGDDETLCTYASLDRVGICVADVDFDSASAHCGGCFQRCRGGAVCEDGACVDEPAAGVCVPPRGHFDCPAGQGCQADNDVAGHCDASVVVGDGGAFAGCDSGADCEGGLCTDGVCTRPCDIGCPAFMVCDDGAIPGGLCVPAPADERCG